MKSLAPQPTNKRYKEIFEEIKKLNNKICEEAPLLSLLNGVPLPANKEICMQLKPITDRDRNKKFDLDFKIPPASDEEEKILYQYITINIDKYDSKDFRKFEVINKYLEEGYQIKTLEDLKNHFEETYLTYF